MMSVSLDVIQHPGLCMHDVQRAATREFPFDPYEWAS